MSSPPSRRLKKSIPKTPNPNPSSSSPSSLGILKEPSSALFPSKGELLRLLGALAIALAVAVSCKYAVNFINRQPKPFCDSNGEDSISDSCEPCPNNGECSKGHMNCLPGYKKSGRYCVEDGEINQTAKKLSEWIEHRVCEASVQFLCNGAGAVWMQEADLWKELDKQNLKEKLGLDNDSYVYAKQKAMGIADGILEIQKSSFGIKELKCPDWLSDKYKTFSCYIRQWIHHHALVLVSLFPLLLGIAAFVIIQLQNIWRNLYLSTRAEQLYQQVCEILEENATTAKTMNNECESWVVASRLRDHLLLPRERKDPLLWKKVEEFVQEDSRLDQYPKLVKGEQKVVWEWQVEGSLSSSRKGQKMITSSKLGSDEGTLKSVAQRRPRAGPSAAKPKSFMKVYNRKRIRNTGSTLEQTVHICQNAGATGESGGELCVSAM
ncbi:hypothetical protein Syun_019158 [Stephania yunnanensis]|uniref:Man1/Src1-like C-terminal domain-containing protein n=1 Tax=Stephania yunnanensis TaxID=152371 RepID=A0AAP0NZ52_9MAGN